MKLEVAMLVGPESKAFLATLAELVERMEAATAATTTTTKKKAAPVATDEDDTDVEADEDEDFAPPKKTAAKKAAASFDEDEDDAPPVKKTKKAKVTVEDVNDAAKARAKAGGKNGRAEVLKILKKGWKTESISEIDPEDYEAVLEALTVED